MWLGEEGVLVPKAHHPLLRPLEHLHLCCEVLVCGKCVKLGLILPRGTLGSSPLLLSQAVCLTPFRSAVPEDAWRPDQGSNPAKNNPIIKKKKEGKKKEKNINSQGDQVPDQTHYREQGCPRQLPGFSLCKATCCIRPILFWMLVLPVSLRATPEEKPPFSAF